MSPRHILLIASILNFFAIVFGAFGAHMLKQKLGAKYFETFLTGNEYHFYHGLTLILIALIKKSYPELPYFNTTVIFCLLGILLFSGNCYLYALTQVKTFALLVPIGGVSFLISWFILGVSIFKLSK